MKQDAFYIRLNGRYEKVLFSGIHYIEACKNYCRLWLGDKPLLILCTLKQFESILPQGHFCRVHRSFIVSLDQMTAFDERFVFLPGRAVPIGDQFREVLHQNILFLIRPSKLTRIPDEPSFFNHKLLKSNF